MYVCMYVYIYVFLCVCVYIYTHTHIHTYIHITDIIDDVHPLLSCTLYNWKSLKGMLYVLVEYAKYVHIHITALGPFPEISHV